MIDVTDEDRVEARVGSDIVGTAHYRYQGDRIVFTHTEVDPQYGGQGVGGALARHALDRARSQHQQVVPLCPFIEGFIDRHPEYDDLVDRDLLALLR